MKYAQICPHYTKPYGGSPKRHNWEFKANEMVWVRNSQKLKRKFVCACGEVQFRTLKDEV